jgi:hypothetical protein
MAYWGYFWQLTTQFHMPTTLKILHDVKTDVRPFLTNAKDELVFLQFVDRLTDISDALAAYSTYAGVCVLLFVSRILKSLDFQERMGLVTKTIEVCMHVCILCQVAQFPGVHGTRHKDYTGMCAVCVCVDMYAFKSILCLVLCMLL